jgi:hypothetical protein
VSAQRWWIKNKPLHWEIITMHRYFISAAIFGLAASPALAVCVADMRAKSGTGAVSGQYYLAVVSNDQCVVAQAQSTIDRQGSGTILSTSNLR